jgi:hypothetical protein
MKFNGSTMATRRVRASAMRAVRFFVQSSTFQRLASSSTTMKPMLWRVRAYSGPGLPSPTTSR